MAMGSGHAMPGPAAFRRLFARVLGPESAFYKVVVVYCVAISLLTLAIPISVQLLIDSVANTGLFSAVLTIGILLFALLLLSGILYALRAWTMELFSRRFFTRVASEMALTGLLARIGHFEAGISDFFLLNVRERQVGEAELKRLQAQLTHQVALAQFYAATMSIEGFGLSLSLW